MVVKNDEGKATLSFLFTFHVSSVLMRTRWGGRFTVFYVELFTFHDLRFTVF